MSSPAFPRPAKIAIIGGGCAAMAAAFELTRPEHRGGYRVTVYQLGWRLGGKAASGRGPADRIEEHGIHVWYGCYENAFRLLRECYAELDRDPAIHRFADWRAAFTPCSHLGVVDTASDGGRIPWIAELRPRPGLPGDPPPRHRSFDVRDYLVRAAELLRTLLHSARGPMHELRHRSRDRPAPRSLGDPREVLADLTALLDLGAVVSVDALLRGLEILVAVFAAPGAIGDSSLLRPLASIHRSLSDQLGALIDGSDERRRVWQMADVVLASLRGAVRFRLASDPRGFDAIDDYDLREWLRLNGAAERSLACAFVRGLYDICFAYEDGDPRRPRLSAGQALRTACRLFFTYRGPFYWRLNAGMGDVVFAPFYEVLKRRGVRFEFFHRLENVRLAAAETLADGERPYVEALDFDVQATIADGGEYSPLIDVRGLPCWPATPDYGQLTDSLALEREGRDFECPWDRRKVATRRLRVKEDFDFAVLAVGLGAIPDLCSELLARDERWRAMVDRVQTVATQAFQVWLAADMDELGWEGPPGNLASFVEPFNTWTDMSQLIDQETWPVPPRSIAYFCSVLPTPPAARPPGPDSAERFRRRVRREAVRFLNRDLVRLWKTCRGSEGGFRWSLLVDPGGSPAASGAGASRFDSQYWQANVYPSDRYVLSLPGSSKYRISPLDNSYDNLTIAGDWTDCGLNAGSVESATISGRLAAHAISRWPPLEDIVGYDHP